MSNLGKLSIHLPPRISTSLVTYSSFKRLIISGPTSTKSITLPLDTQLSINGSTMSIAYPESPEMWGTLSQYLRQIIKGVTVGFSQTLTLSGIGFKASLKDDILTLSLGFTHDINLKVPKEIEASCSGLSVITLKSNSLQKLTAFTHLIAGYKKASKDKYKNKGVVVSPTLV